MMGEDLRAALKMIIDDANWMDDATLQKAQEKVKKKHKRVQWETCDQERRAQSVLIGVQVGMGDVGVGGPG